MSFLEYMAQVLGTDVETVLYGLELGAFATWSYMLLDEDEEDEEEEEEDLDDDEWW